MWHYQVHDLVGRFFHGLAGVLGKDFVERSTSAEDFVRLDFDVGDLSADAAVWLVNHDF